MIKKAASPSFPLTSYAVLGLLSYGESTGYDLLKLATQSTSFFWVPTRSHVYLELAKLVKHGLATDQELRQKSRPDKKLFKITQKGVRELKRWLETGEAEDDTIRSPFMLQVFFGQHVSRDITKKRLKAHQAEMSEQIERLREVEKELKQSPSLFYPWLTLSAGIARELHGRDRRRSLWCACSR